MKSPFSSKTVIPPSEIPALRSAIVRVKQRRAERASAGVDLATGERRLHQLLEEWTARGEVLLREAAEALLGSEEYMAARAFENLFHANITGALLRANVSLAIDREK